MKENGFVCLLLPYTIATIANFTFAFLSACFIVVCTLSVAATFTISCTKINN